MKKLILVGLAIVLVSISFISCKKGEHDPFLSLKSRKARISGIWTIKEEVINETNVDHNTTETIKSTYDGALKFTSTVTTIVGDSTTTDTSSIKYTYKLDIQKNGTYIQTIAYSNLIDITTIEGTWMFIGKSKINKLKNKEAILFTTTKSINSYGSTADVVKYTDLNGKTFVIDQLKKDEMITLVEVNSNNENGLISSKSLTKTTYTKN